MRRVTSFIRRANSFRMAALASMAPLAYLPRSGMKDAVRSPVDFGALVRRTRSSLGLSQETLATAAGVGPRFVVELEAGEATVQLDSVMRC